MEKTNSKDKFYKSMDIINLIFALFLASSPLVLSLIHLLWDGMVLSHLFIVFGAVYINYIPIVLVPKLLKKNYRKRFLRGMKTLPMIFIYILVGWMLLSTIVNNAVNIYLIVYIIYFLIFICVYCLQDKYKTLLINTLLITMSICCIMGCIDPYNDFLIGFSKVSYPQSLQFYNPNYSGYLMAMLTIFNIYLLATTKKTYQKIISAIAHTCMTLHLFMNGSFSPITGLYIGIILFIIYQWVTTKKCPIKFLLILTSIIAIMFLVDLIPNIKQIRTCEYNFFLECIAVIDNILGTKILPTLTGIDGIKGADGWNRDELQREAIASIFSNAKTFFFGGGAGNDYNYRPHNAILSSWLDFGIVAPLCYIAIVSYVVVKFFRSKSKDKHATLGVIGAIIGYFFMLMFGSIIEFHFSFFVIMLSIAYKEINHLYKKKKVKNLSEDKETEEPLLSESSLSEETTKTSKVTNKNVET